MLVINTRTISTLASSSHYRAVHKLGFHYGWIILAFCACLSVAAGFLIQSTGVVFIHLHDHSGWAPAHIAFGASLFFLTSALCAPVVGAIIDRYGSALAAATGVLAVVSGVLVSGMATEIWHYWIGYGLFLGVAYSCIRLATALAITEWFQRRLALALGILQASFAIGPAVLIVLFSFLLEIMGWRTAVWFMGLVCGCGLAALLPFFRSRPADLALQPFGAVRGTESRPAWWPGHIHHMRAKAFWNSVKTTRTFWSLAIIHLLGCAGHIIVLVFIAPLAKHVGIDHQAAALILSVLVAVSVVGRLFVPVITDRLESKWVLLTILLLQGLPVLGLLWADTLWQFLAIAVVFAVGFGAEVPMLLVITCKYFGPGPMGRPFGCYETLNGLAMGVCLLLAVMSYDAFGTYNYALAFAIGCSLIAAVVAISLKPLKTSRYYEWERSLPLEARSPNFFQWASSARNMRYVIA